MAKSDNKKHLVVSAFGNIYLSAVGKDKLTMVGPKIEIDKGDFLKAIVDFVKLEGNGGQLIRIIRDGKPVHYVCLLDIEEGKPTHYPGSKELLDALDFVLTPQGDYSTMSREELLEKIHALQERATEAVLNHNSK